MRLHDNKSHLKDKTAIYKEENKEALETYRVWHDALPLRRVSNWGLLLAVTIDNPVQPLHIATDFSTIINYLSQ